MVILRWEPAVGIVLIYIRAAPVCTYVCSTSYIGEAPVYVVLNYVAVCVHLCM